jgi:hypothetical protein
MLSRHPSAELLEGVECIWHHESPDTRARGRERVLPDGRFQVVLNLSAGTAAVSGLRSHHVVIDTARVSHVMGVVFRSAAARPFFEEPALDFYDRSVSLALVWGQRRVNFSIGCGAKSRREEGSPFLRRPSLRSRARVTGVGCGATVPKPCAVRLRRPSRRFPFLQDRRGTGASS